MKLGNDLAKLAEHIAKKATQKDTSFQESVDAFKALITYYSAVNKIKGRTADESSDEPNFLSFQEALNGSTEVRGSARGRTGENQ